MNDLQFTAGLAETNLQSNTCIPLLCHP